MSLKQKLQTLISGLKEQLLNKSQGSFIASSALAQFLPLIAVPIITRMYSPSAFGTYAVFYALVAILGSAASLSFHNAIILEKDDADSWHATSLSIIVSIVFCAIVTLTIHTTSQTILQSLLGFEITEIIYWLPLTILLSSGYQTLYTSFIRLSKYSTLGRNKLILSLATVFIQICIGTLQLEATGFVLANLIGYTLAIILLLSSTHDLPYIKIFATPTKVLVATASKHRKLPVFTLPAGLINSFGTQIPELMINKLFGSYQLGQYSLANRMVSIPLSFLSSSLQDIFRQQATKEFNEAGTCTKSYRIFFVILLLTSTLFLIPIVLLAPLVFPIIFGNQWGEAGFLIRALVFLIAVRFISSPLSYIWIIKGKQHVDLFWQIGLLIISAIAFMLSSYIIFNPTMIQTLFIYSTMTGVWYIFCIFISKHYSI